MGVDRIGSSRVFEIRADGKDEIVEIHVKRDVPYLSDVAGLGSTEPPMQNAGRAFKAESIGLSDREVGLAPETMIGREVYAVCFRVDLLATEKEALGVHRPC